MSSSISVGQLRNEPGFECLSDINGDTMVLSFSELEAAFLGRLRNIYGTKNLQLHAVSGNIEVTIKTGDSSE